MKNAKGGGGKFTLKWYWLSAVLVPCVIGVVSLCSSRNYKVPDPPGLFDGHVWPMYLEHKKIMEASSVDVCKSFVLSFILRATVFSYIKMNVSPIDLYMCAITVQLDGTKSKEQLFNFVYGNILNSIQKSL